MPLGVLTTFSELGDYLTREGVPFESEPENTTVRIPTRVGESGEDAWLSWQEDAGLVVCFLPLGIPLEPARFAAMAEAVLRINHGLAELGFGLDYENAVVYMRSSRAFDNSVGLDEEEVAHLYGTTARTANQLAPVLAQVASGDVAAADVLLAARAHLTATSLN